MVYFIMTKIIQYFSCMRVRLCTEPMKITMIVCNSDIDAANLRSILRQHLGCCTCRQPRAFLEAPAAEQYVDIARRKFFICVTTYTDILFEHVVYNPTAALDKMIVIGVPNIARVIWHQFSKLYLWEMLVFVDEKPDVFREYRFMYPPPHPYSYYQFNQQRPMTTTTTTTTTFSIIFQYIYQQRDNIPLILLLLLLLLIHIMININIKAVSVVVMVTMELLF